MRVVKAFDFVVIPVCVQSFVDTFRFFFPSPLKDNPLNPPSQGDGRTPLPPDKGGRGVQEGRTGVSALPSFVLLHVQIVGEGGVGHEKLVPGFGALAHEFGEGAVGVEFILQLDFEEPARGGIQRRLLELLGKHFAETLEPADDRREPHQAEQASTVSQLDLG